MHLSVLFRFHCTTKADHAIDLSPWMVFRVLNWFDYRINLCMTEREKSQWKPTHTHLIITVQFLLSNSSCIAFEICAVNVFVFAHLMSLQWRTPTHTRSLAQNLPLKANHNRNNTQTIYLQNSQIFAMWQIGNTSQFIRFQFSGERTALHTQSMAEHVKKKGREKKRKIGWNKVLNRDWTSFPLRWKLMNK